MAKEKIPLLRLITGKWFLSTEELAKRTGVMVETISKVLEGGTIGRISEARLRRYLESYEGEV